MAHLDDHGNIQGLTTIYILLITILCGIIGNTILSDNKLSIHKEEDAQYYQRVAFLESFVVEQKVLNTSLDKGLKVLQLNQVIIGTKLGVEGLTAIP